MSISKSMVSFQALLKPLSKDSENPFFRSSYLSLAGILDGALPLMTSCGLSVSQPMRIDNGVCILQTRITHENGEFLLSEMILPQIADPQKFGSLITYYKRYQLQAMLGICSKDDDDDGNHAFYNPAQNKPPVTKEAAKEKAKEFVDDFKARNNEHGSMVENVRVLLGKLTTNDSVEQKAQALFDICGVKSFPDLRKKKVEDLREISKSISEIIKERDSRKPHSFSIGSDSKQ